MYSTYILVGHVEKMPWVLAVTGQGRVADSRAQQRRARVNVSLTCLAGYFGSANGNKVTGPRAVKSEMLLFVYAQKKSCDRALGNSM